MEAHLAEPAETRDRRGSKRRAKTDRADARLLRDLLLAGNLPESWIPPDHLADLRTTVRLRKALTNERSAWVRRMHAQLFHHGLPLPPDLSTRAGRQLPRTGQPARRGTTGSRHRLFDVDHLDQQLDAVDAELMPLARRLPGCQVLCRQWGIGLVLGATILAELGDTRRFSRSRQSVRFAGIDVTVEDSDGKRTRGHLSRQGSTDPALGPLRGCRSRLSAASPDHQYYVQAKADWAPSGLASPSPVGCCAGSTTISPKLATPPSPKRPEPRCGGAHQPMICDLLPPSPVAARCAGDLIRTSGRTSSTENPITHHVAGQRTRAPR